MKNKNAIFYIIGGLVIIGGTIGAYFLFRKPKEDEENDSDNEEESEEVVSSGGTKIPTELNTNQKVKDFQKWVYYTKNDKSLATSKVADGVDGIYGSRTKTAWDKYKTEYLQKASTPAETSVSYNKEDIDTIINNASGTKAQRTNLYKTDPTFIVDWAKAIRNKRTAFVWANQVYSVIKGEKILTFNPLNKTVYATKDGQWRKMEAKDSASATSVSKGEEIGIVTSFFYDKEKNTLFLFVPKTRTGVNAIYKWVYASAVTTTKPSSSFDGASNYEFATLGDNLDLNL